MLVLSAAALGVGVYAYAGSHVLLPGHKGCSYVRNVYPRAGCYEKRIAAMQGNKTPFELAELVALEAESDSTLQANCHQALHPFGEQAGRDAIKNGDPPPDYSSDDICMQGFGHGFIIAQNKAKSASELRDSAGISCDPDHTISTPLDCLHALGHSLMKKRKNVDLAVSDCEGVDYDALKFDEQITMIRQGSTTGWKSMVQEECNKGVYMETAFGATKKEVEDPLAATKKLCATVKRDRALCAKYAPLYANMVGASIQKSLTICDQFRGDQKLRCGYGAGIVVANKEQCSKLSRRDLVDECSRAVFVTRGE